MSADRPNAPDAQPPPLKRRTRPAVIIVGAIVAACIGACTFFAIVLGTLKATAPYQVALARIQASNAVGRVLGPPIKPSYFVFGNIHTSGAAGQAQFEFQIVGSKTKGQAALAAHRQDGKWVYEYLIVQVDPTSAPIDLLKESAEAEKRPKF
jgi:hypothetical protein